MKGKEQIKCVSNEMVALAKKGGSNWIYKTVRNLKIPFLWINQTKN